MPLLLSLFVFCQNSGADDPELDFFRSFIRHPNRMIEWNQALFETRHLLERFKPVIYIAPDSYRPMSFYRDYLPNCDVRSVKTDSDIQTGRADRQLLMEIQFAGDNYLDYQLSPEQALALTEKDVHPTIYGRVYTDTLSDGNGSVSLIFLKYSLVYPHSGLPAKIGFLKRMGSSIIGHRKGWHELDIHGAIHIVLHGETKKPIGLILAQHNHHRVLLAGKDFIWPENDRVSISVAQYSNEPYLLPSGAPHRLAPVSGNPMNLEFLFGVSKRVPFNGGFDKIFTLEGGAINIDTALEFLSLDDPLYRASIPLGDRRKIFGLWDTWYMRGPPGIDFYTFPELKNLADLMAFWFIDPSDKTFFKLVKKQIKSFYDYNVLPVLKHQKKRLLHSLRKAYGT